MLGNVLLVVLKVLVWNGFWTLVVVWKCLFLWACLNNVSFVCLSSQTISLTHCNIHFNRLCCLRCFIVSFFWRIFCVSFSHSTLKLKSTWSFLTTRSDVVIQDRTFCQLKNWLVGAVKVFSFELDWLVKNGLKGHFWPTNPAQIKKHMVIFDNQFGWGQTMSPGILTGWCSESFLIWAGLVGPTNPAQIKKPSLHQPANFPADRKFWLMQWLFLNLSWNGWSTMVLQAIFDQPIQL